jgi:hypothetical protein
MIVYRIQVHIGTEWLNIWLPTSAEAKKELATFEKSDHAARLDQIEVGPGREGLCRLLNLADANHMNLEGKLVARTSQLDPRGQSCQRTD